MPEGPLLVLWKEQTKDFIGKKITEIENNTKLTAERIKGKTITDIKTWGKHFLICFDDFMLRTHFFNVWRLVYQQKKTARKAR